MRPKNAFHLDLSIPLAYLSCENCLEVELMYWFAYNKVRYKFCTQKRREGGCGNPSPGGRNGLVKVPPCSEPPLSPEFRCSRKEGWREEGLFCYRRGSNQRVHHQHPQAHPWSGLQEACCLGAYIDPEICHEGDGNSRCAHWHQAQQSPLDQRNEERPIPYPGVVVQKAKWGWRFTKQALYIGHLCTCHHFQKSTNS